MRVEEAGVDYLVSSQATEWLRGTLGELLPIKYGKSLPEKLRDTAGSHPVFGSSGLVGTHSSTLTSGPTLIIGRKGNVGAIHYSSEACWPIDTVYYVEPPEGQNLRYYKYLLESLNLVKLDKSTAVPGLSRDDYNAVEVVVAPPEQQDEIVAEIEKQFSRLDEAVANLKRVKANLKRYKAAVLKAAASGRLVETEAERARREGRGFETGAQLLQRILETRRSQWQGKGKYKEPAAPDTTDLPELPEGWVWCSGAQLFEWSSGEGLTEKNQRTGPYPVYGGNGISGHHDEYFVEEPTLVVGRVGAHCGNVYVTKSKCWITDNAIYAKSFPNDEPLEYLQIVFTQAGLNRIAAGSGQPFVNQRMLNEVSIPLPPLDEQLRIVKEVDRRLSLLRETEAQVNANLQRAERLRQAILANAFACAS